MMAWKSDFTALMLGKVKPKKCNRQGKVSLAGGGNYARYFLFCLEIEFILSIQSKSVDSLAIAK